jgi:hypothetical protein
MNLRRYSADGIRDSAQRLDPRPLGGLHLSPILGSAATGNPETDFRAYCRKFNVRPHVYCFNLAAYGDTQFPADKVYQLSGFSDKVFDTMALLETDRLALVKEINAIDIGYDERARTSGARA